MRIISFSEKWPKLRLELPVGQRPDFTTFRFPRKDTWKVGEEIQVYYKSRSPEREKLGEAVIIRKDFRKIATAYEPYRPTEKEAIADGFPSLFSMNTYFRKTYGASRLFEEIINKLTLRWLPTPPINQSSEGEE